MKKRSLSVLMALILTLSMAGCGGGLPAVEQTPAPTAVPTQVPAEAPEQVPEAEPAPVEKNGDIVILYTGDVHCAVERGFGYDGVRRVRDAFEAKGCTTLLVDVGDAIEGKPIGALTRGEAIIEIMNTVGYDVAIPGNHEFDYGMDRFLELTEMAEFPYVSCNFNIDGDLVLEPYVIREAAGKKIAFVGVTTPRTLQMAGHVHLLNDAGEFVCGFCQDKTGEGLYSAVQAAADSAREAGADYVVALSHLGNLPKSTPWSCAQVISNTSGSDAFLDGHSHDTDQMIVQNADGQEVPRSASGTQLKNIGYLKITADGQLSVGLYNWPNKVSARELFGIDNAVSRRIDELNAELAVLQATEAELSADPYGQAPGP